MIQLSIAQDTSLIHVVADLSKNYEKINYVVERLAQRSSDNTYDGIWYFVATIIAVPLCIYLVKLLVNSNEKALDKIDKTMLDFSGAIKSLGEKVEGAILQVGKLETENKGIARDMIEAFKRMSDVENKISRLEKIIIRHRDLIHAHNKLSTDEMLKLGELEEELSNLKSELSDLRVKQSKCMNYDPTKG